MSFDAFMRFVAQAGACRTADSDWRLYERLKADLVRQFPAIEPRQYQAAINAISRAAGV